MFVSFCRDVEKKKSVKKRVTEYSSDTDLQGPLPKKIKKSKNKNTVK